MSERVDPDARAVVSQKENEPLNVPHPCAVRLSSPISRRTKLVHQSTPFWTLKREESGRAHSY